jgi:hypothetical protein
VNGLGRQNQQRRIITTNLVHTLERPPEGGLSVLAICYLQQVPPSQQAGSPQQALMVAAEAERDKSITAANANDRTLIFIKTPLGFQQKNDTTT